MNGNQSMTYRVEHSKLEYAWEAIANHFIWLETLAPS